MSLESRTYRTWNRRDFLGRTALAVIGGLLAYPLAKSVYENLPEGTIDEKVDISESTVYEKAGIYDESLQKRADEFYAQIRSEKAIIGERQKTRRVRNKLNGKVRRVKVTKTVTDLETGKKTQKSVMEKYAITLGWEKEKAAYSRKFSIMTQFRDLLEESSDNTGLHYNLVMAQATQESAGSISAESHAGALGFWQFMDDTAREYGASVDDFVDDRRNPIKSNRKYIKFARDKISMFKGNIAYAIAAYNTGAGNVFEAIGKAGASEGADIHRTLGIVDTLKLKDDHYREAGKLLFKEQNYQPKWKLIEKHLHPETSQYVPEILAKFRLLEEAHKLGIKIENQELYTAKFADTEPYVIRKGDWLTKVARSRGIDTEEITALNPELVDKNYFKEGRTILLPQR